MSKSSTRTRKHESAENRGGAPAFTLVELLVVIVVIGFVMSLLLLVGGRVLNNQKRSTTQNTMRLTDMAIDQFKNTNPLQDVYDNAKLRVGSTAVGRLFGPYPPYQLAGGRGPVVNPTTVRCALEPDESLTWSTNYTLNERLARDLGVADDTAHFSIPTPDTHPKANADDVLAFYSYDNRALYCYLAAFAPGVLNQVPDSAKKPLRSTAEMIDPSVTGGLPSTPGPNAFNVLGIYDAWGVPLDYFLQVKLDYKIGPNGINPQWVVTDRMPVLRSLGISKEEAVAEAGGTDDLDPQKWIFSQPFPQPAAKCLNDPKAGRFSGSTSVNDGGWVRMRAGANAGDEPTWDSYEYVPPQP